ncbi:GFA family protein [Phenylobacterium montanum]|uniref:GFA family protein n=1 Tax=Phenylobacterium montanum TaxID=2823693 RepID=A0A975FW90_9CAUL|nr:GFA family protein [Caulobacter sp. S6]QUD86124.1 GFA family protein [Caulobacter sp. S6]
MPQPESRTARPILEQAQGRCLCEGVVLEIDVPAFWAWHDHSAASRRAQGCAYATYIGCWKSRVRVLQGEELIARYDEPVTGAERSFCRRCGSPLFYARRRAPKMINIPRGLFEGRTGREPRYHLGCDDQVDWAYAGEPLSPLKGYPGVMRARSRRRVLEPDLL